MTFRMKLEQFEYHSLCEVLTDNSFKQVYFEVFCVYIHRAIDLMNSSDVFHQNKLNVDESDPFSVRYSGINDFN